eukprot:10279093-Alexandrium_andersonii.AAC.1
MGFSVSENFDVDDGRGRVANALEGPMNVLLPWLLAASVDRAVAAASERRSTLAGVGRVDYAGTMAYPNSLPDPQFRFWLHIVSGAVWTPELKVKAGLTDSEACRMCGGE